MQRKFYILDGLRGILAIIVVAYHILQLFYQSIASLPLHHAYLAVDFFFLLSGFVIGFAYDHRWTTMGKKEFFTTRLIRLHPLALAGLALGVIVFAFTTNYGNATGLTPWLLLLMATLHALLLPYTGMQNSGDQTHALNGPSWSLFQEYLVNIVYAFLARKMSNKILGLLVIASGLLLTIGAIRLNTLNGGWDWTNFWMGPVRVFFSFFAGLFIFRSGFRLSVSFAFPALGVCLLFLILFPVIQWNGLYDAFCVVILFPLFLAIGAGSKQSGPWLGISKISGEISYPLYILHAPVISAFGFWVQSAQHPVSHLKIVAIAAFVGCLLVSWLFLQYFDKPVRAWLNVQGKLRQIRPSIFGRFFGQFPAYKAASAQGPSPNLQA